MQMNRFRMKFSPVLLFLIFLIMQGCSGNGQQPAGSGKQSAADTLKSGVEKKAAGEQVSTQDTASVEKKLAEIQTLIREKEKALEQRESKLEEKESKAARLQWISWIVLIVGLLAIAGAIIYTYRGKKKIAPKKQP